MHILDNKKDSPLHLGIEGGHVGVAENLLLGRADNAVRGSKGDYPIHRAARRGHEEIVQALAHKGADLNCFTTGGRPPLAVAVLETPPTSKFFSWLGVLMRTVKLHCPINRPALGRCRQQNTLHHHRARRGRGRHRSQEPRGEDPALPFSLLWLARIPRSPCCTWGPMSTRKPTLD